MIQHATSSLYILSSCRGPEVCLKPHPPSVSCVLKSYSFISVSHAHTHVHTDWCQTDVRETVSKSSSESVSYNGSVVKRTLTSSSPAITHTHTDFFVSPHAYPCPHHTSFFPCYITPLPHQHNDKLWQKLWRSLTRSSVLFRPANTHKRTHTRYTHTCIIYWHAYMQALLSLTW